MAETGFVIRPILKRFSPGRGTEMSTAEIEWNVCRTSVNPPPSSGNAATPLQRLGEVQREQGVSDRTMAMRLGVSMEQIRRQQSPTCDMSLCDLYRWQAALDVPIADLLVEPGPALAPVVERRARLVKMMKTVRSLQLAADSPDVGALVEYLAEQLVQLMPELVHVDSWPLVGKRRGPNDVAPLEERVVLTFGLEGHCAPENE
jgi:hypothetical protein